jgi:hypothetical protein
VRAYSLYVRAMRACVCAGDAGDAQSKCLVALIADAFCDHKLTGASHDSFFSPELGSVVT